jgi:pre-rRNA-processing protein TSR3
VVLSRLIQSDLGHRDWAERILMPFKWGKSFFEVNEPLLQKYARCNDAEEMVEVQQEWLERLDREWEQKRGNKDEDEWAGGNPNRRESFDEGSDDGEQDEQDEQLDNESDDDADESETESRINRSEEQETNADLDVKARVD